MEMPSRDDLCVFFLTNNDWVIGRAVELTVEHPFEGSEELEKGTKNLRKTPR